jgi:hypothetical protein
MNQVQPSSFSSATDAMDTEFVIHASSKLLWLGLFAATLMLLSSIFGLLFEDMSTTLGKSNWFTLVLSALWLISMGISIYSFDGSPRLVVRKKAITLMSEDGKRTEIPITTIQGFDVHGIKIPRSKPKFLLDDGRLIKGLFELSEEEYKAFLPVLAQHVPPSKWSSKAREFLQTKCD